MSNIKFNDQALEATFIILAKDEMAKLIAKLYTEVLKKVHDSCKEDFKLVLEKFARIGEQKVASGSPEGVMDFVERLRKYRPMYQPEEYQAFSQKGQAFAMNLRMAANATYGAHPIKWRETYAEYMNEAMFFSAKVATARALRDQVALEDLIIKWNEIAVKWNAAVNKAKSSKQPTTTQ